MTITTVAPVFIAAGKIDGASVYSSRLGLPLFLMPSGPQGSNFLVGVRDSFNPAGGGTYDHNFAASFLYPAFHNGFGSNGAGPAIGTSTTLASTTGQVNEESQDAFTFAAPRDGGGYVAAINAGTSMADMSFSLKFVSSSGVLEQSVDPSPANGNPKFVAGVSRLDNGNYLVTWSELPSPGGVLDADVFGIIMNSSGVPQGSAFQISAPGADLYFGGRIIDTGAGAFVVFERLTTSGGGDPVRTEFMGQKIDASGNPVGGNFSIASVTPTDGFFIDEVTYVSLANGGFVTFWLEQAPSTQSWKYHAEFIDALGNLIASPEVAIGSGSRAPWLDATDLANGGAALILTSFQGFDAIGNEVGTPVAYKYNYDGTYNGTLSGGLPVGEAFSAGPLRPFTNYELSEDGRILQVYAGANDVLGQYWNFNYSTQINGDRFADQNDTLYGDEGVDDVMFGQNGNDILFGLSGSDVLSGGGGEDILNGGADGDTADYSQSTSGGFTITLTDGTNANGDLLGTGVSSAAVTDSLISIERIRGSNFNDTITGNSIDNILRGNRGNDYIDGGAGIDTADYSSALANDTVTVILTDTADGNGKLMGSSTSSNLDPNFGAGADTLRDIENIYGGAGNDLLTGNYLDNLLRGNGGNDTLNGGAGNDIVDYRNSARGVSVTLTDGNGIHTGGFSVADGPGPGPGFVGGDGNDILIDIERIRGSRYNDVLIGNSFDNILRGMEGDDVLNGAGGVDWAGYQDATGAVSVTLTDSVNGHTGGSSTGAGGNDILTDIERLIGSDFDDTLTGNAGNNFLRGGKGADILNGGGQLPGSIYNGFGSDWADYASATIGVIANLANATLNTGDAKGDTYINIESLRGSDFNDTLTGDANNNSFQGGLGNDIIDGAAGNDFASYNNATGGVTVVLTNVSGGNSGGSATGGGGNDTLINIESITGSDFNDSITGNSSHNTFRGEKGDDFINGSGGIDTVSYAAAEGGVTVTLTDAAGGLSSGADGNDTLANIENITGSDFADILIGNSAINVLDGRDGLDIASYSNAAGSISVNLASGKVTGAGGNDILRSIENVTGGAFNDTFNATSFSAASANAGSAGNINSFDGRGGDDTFTGNGNTQIAYRFAMAGVTVDLQAGTAVGDASVGNDVILGGVTSIRGSSHIDTLLGSTNATGAETFTGDGGNDIIDGRGGFDRASYFTFLNDVATDGVAVNLAAGVVTGDASIGVDSLRSVEAIRGTRFFDIYDATGFTASSINAGSEGVNDLGAALNEFEGMGGDDEITGNGNTRLAFHNASAGVMADLAAGTSTSLGANDAADVGNDTFTGVSRLVGSEFADVFFGNNNASGTTEVFDGRGGNDTFDGRGGFDRAIYNLDSATKSGISVNMAAGTVTGPANIGTDILIAIEAIRGTNFADIYNGLGFNGASTDTGFASSFNEFEGMSGNDSITGNGNTRIAYTQATNRVVVDMLLGTAIGNSSVGTDTFTGVSRVRGSAFADVISGGDGNDRLEGQDGSDQLNGRNGDDIINGENGDDTIDGGTGNDTMTGGLGNDTYYIDGTTDFVFEGAAEGTQDLAFVTGSWTLGTGQYVERLYANGSAGSSITGNELRNTIYGNAGNDMLSGAGGIDTITAGAGSDRISGGLDIDTLIGGADADTFVLENLTVNRDVIRDFVGGTDKLEISASLFGGGLTAGVGLTGVQFVANATAAAAGIDYRFVYNTTNGYLYYDANGSGAGPTRQVIAALTGAPALSASDIVIV